VTASGNPPVWPWQNVPLVADIPGREPKEAQAELGRTADQRLVFSVLVVFNERPPGCKAPGLTRVTRTCDGANPYAWLRNHW